MANVTDLKQYITPVLAAAALACGEITAPPAFEPSQRADVEAQATGDVYVMVQTVPDGAGVEFSFTHDIGGSVPSPFVIGDNQLEIFNAVPVGTYTITQTAPAGWGLLTSGDGFESMCFDEFGESALDLASATATVVVPAGGFVVCVFVNGEVEDPDPPPDEDPPGEDPPGEDPPEEDPPPPHTQPVGSGAWKHGLCTAGAADPAILSDPAVVPFGALNTLTCAQARNLLSKQDFTGTQRANDGAFNLASALLTARLNVAAGGSLPECVANAIARAQEILADLGFDGTGDYLPPKTANKTLRSEALALGGLLGRYNELDSAVLAGNCG